MCSAGGIPQIARIDDPRNTLQHMLAGEVPTGDAIQRLTGMGVAPALVCAADRRRPQARASHRQ